MHPNYIKLIIVVAVLISILLLVGIRINASKENESQETNELYLIHMEKGNYEEA